MGEVGSKTVVMTGATGFLGSHLLAALLERGHRVAVLGRGQEAAPLEKRLGELLEWFDLGATRSQLECYEADLLQPRCGLSRSRYLALCLKTSEVIHLASDTRFAESNRAQSLNTNVRSLASVLELARHSSVSGFHYVSTAYTSSPGMTVCREEVAHAGCHANVYEETKAWAELEVAAQCDREGIPYTILRPSIVYGDSRSGRANRFTALYHHVRSLSQIRDIYLQDLRYGGVKSRSHGIRLDEQGVLHLPLKIYLPRKGVVNLIPIDYFVAVALAVFEKGASGSVYHVTSSQPETMEELACYCEEFLRLEGIEIRYGERPQQLQLNPAEALFEKFVEPYRPYLADTRLFDRTNTDLVTHGLTPPRLSYDVFRRCMEYALTVNWGR